MNRTRHVYHRMHSHQDRLSSIKEDLVIISTHTLVFPTIESSQLEIIECRISKRYRVESRKIYSIIHYKIRFHTFNKERLNRIEIVG